jgi:hypothetical protein
MIRREIGACSKRNRIAASDGSARGSCILAVSGNEVSRSRLHGALVGIQASAGWHVFGGPSRYRAADRSHAESMRTLGMPDAIVRLFHAFAVRVSVWPVRGRICIDACAQSVLTSGSEVTPSKSMTYDLFERCCPVACHSDSWFPYPKKCEFCAHFFKGPAHQGLRRHPEEGARGRLLSLYGRKMGGRKMKADVSAQHFFAAV